MTEPSVRAYPLPEAPDLPFRLGRGVQHDERSRAFAFTAPERLELRDVAWRRRVGPYDQGADVMFGGILYHGLGSCTFNGLAGALSTLPHHHRFRSQQRITEGYAAATAIDPFPGTFPPDDTGSSGLAVAKVALSRGWISRYDWAFSFDAVLQSLMLYPGITGTVWRSQMFHPDPDGRVRIGGSDAGGHEYEVYGVDVQNRRLWCWQSWGTDWGIGGRFWLSWDDYRELLAADGDYTILVP